MTILIVDDNATNRKLLRVTLTAEGHQVFQAENGAEACGILALQSVDAIISEVVMPMMDGYQLCRVLRCSSPYRDVPFVFYSSNFPASESLASAFGADKYVRRPATTFSLLSALHKVIHKRLRGSLREGRDDALLEGPSRKVRKRAVEVKAPVISRRKKLSRRRKSGSSHERFKP
jgi:CheY-like chemotaxis protein